MQTVLITGGAGFIGSNLVEYLHDKYNYKTVVLDCLTYAGNITNLRKVWDSPRFEFIHGNICNASLVDELVSRSDMIVHLAAESRVTRSIHDNLTFFMTDVLGTQILCNSICKHKNVQRFIHVSTSEVYGTAWELPMGEDHPLQPMSPCAAAKCGADRLVHSYWRTYGIPAIILRLFNNYGPRQHLEKVIPRFITSVILNEPIRIHGDGKAARDYVHVDDTCRAIDLVLHHKDSLAGGEFNVGSGLPTSLNLLAATIKLILEKPKHPIEHTEDRPGQVKMHKADCTDLWANTKWKSEIELDKGLQRTVYWYLNNRDWWEPQLWLREIPIITADGRKEMH